MLVASVVVLQGQAPAAKQPVKGKTTTSVAKAATPDWRKSVEKFGEAFSAYFESNKDKQSKGARQLPVGAFEDLTYGGPVSSEWEVMRLFGGQIEWAGVFEGIEKGTDARPEKIKIKAPVTISATGTNLVQHIYPSPNSLSQWRGTPVGSVVRYSGTIEGITSLHLLGKAGIFVTIKDAALIP